MPTLVACAAAGLALVTAVGLQAPAVSVGLRWRPGPPSRGLDLIPIKPDENYEFAFDVQPDSGWPDWLLWVLAALVVVAPCPCANDSPPLTVHPDPCRRFGRDFTAASTARPVVGHEECSDE